MTLKVQIAYATVTGNTRRMAEHIEAALRSAGHDVSIAETRRMNEIPEADLYIIAFWCRKSGMDDVSRTFSGRLAGHRVIAVGTIGGDASGAYGRRVEETSRTQLSPDAVCLGVRACQGGLSPARLERRRALPKEDPHWMNDEKYARHLRDMGRPNADDLREVSDYILQTMEKMNDN